MTKYLVDTTVLIDHLHNKASATALLRDLAVRKQVVGVCSVNLAEAVAGLHPRDFAQAKILFEALTLFHTGAEAAWQAGRYQYDFARKGIALSLPDMLVAATAIQEGATLVTSNVKDFPMPELALLPNS